MLSYVKLWLLWLAVAPVFELGSLLLQNFFKALDNLLMSVLCILGVHGDLVPNVMVKSGNTTGDLKRVFHTLSLKLTAHQLQVKRQFLT